MIRSRFVKDKLDTVCLKHLQCLLGYMNPMAVVQNIADANLWPVFASESLKALLGLGLISLGGRLFLRRIFEVCLPNCNGYTPAEKTSRTWTT
jgi:hypothetical protein